MFSALAVLSDVHGNIWALEAVLADIARRGIDRVVNLGDSVYGPLDPHATADRLLQLDVPTVRGNQDRIVVDAAAPITPALAQVRAALASDHVAWLRWLPPTLSIDGVLLCHGTPGSDETYLLEEAPPEGQRLRPPDAIVHLLGGSRERLVLCGHSHLPRAVALPDGTLVVNPGSVGVPAYVESAPPHAMETGSPHARYAVVAPVDRGWRVEQIAVPYDWEAAARRAWENGRDDWAQWLSGWAGPAPTAAAPPPTIARRSPPPRGSRRESRL